MSVRGAILGLGRRGELWAELCLAAGWDLTAFDPSPGSAAAEVRLRGIRREATISAAVRRADWIFCCLPDRLELIQMVMQRAQAEAPDGAIIAVASPALDVEALQGCAMRPAHVLRISLASDGGCLLDVTDRNPEEVRDMAEAVATQLMALGAPEWFGPDDAQDFSAESA